MASGIKISLMDGTDHLRMAQIPVLGMFAGLQSPGLQQGSYTAVQKQQVVFQKFKNGHDVLL